jgi:prohibitin 1
MAAFMPLLNRLAGIGIGMSVVGGIANTCLYNVEGGFAAVIFDQFRGGVQDEVKGEGTHFLIPLVQTPIFYDMRLKPRQIPVVTGSKDLQNVSITLRILHRPQRDKLPVIHKTLGPDYDERVLPSIGNEVLKAVVAEFDAAELITQREGVSNTCRERLNKRAREFNINMEDISITHLTFGHEFTHAVELKQVAQQEAERARYTVMQAEQEKLANIIRAEGDSEAAELISGALAKHGRGLIELRRIEAARDIARTLSKSRNVAYLPSGNGLLLNMSV